MQITWLSYFGSENQGVPLRSWFVTRWLWRHIPTVTLLAVPSSCVVTQTSMGTNSGTRSRKRKFPLLFVNCDRGRIEIDHLYGLRWSGWCCNPEQHSLCRPARPTTGTTRAVPDCSTNHSSADRIVVNSYNSAPWVTLVCHLVLAINLLPGNRSKALCDASKGLFNTHRILIDSHCNDEQLGSGEKFSTMHDDVIKWKHFRVTGHLCGEFTGPRWIPRTKASDAELWCFLWSAPD